MKKNDILTSKLVETYGCHACKSQVADDDFLTGHGRFWCAKKKQSLESDNTAHIDCPSWSFSGDEKLLQGVFQPTLPNADHETISVNGDPEISREKFEKVLGKIK